MHSCLSLKFVKFVYVAESDHGKREHNTLVTCPEDEYNPAKAGIILDKSGGSKDIPT